MFLCYLDEDVRLRASERMFGDPAYSFDEGVSTGSLILYVRHVKICEYLFRNCILSIII